MTDEKKKKRLLLIDDEKDFRESASRALGRQGFSMLLAESGERALQLLRSESTDLVILDLRMEGMDGISTLEEIRGTNPDLPVLILTGHGSYEDALAGIKLKVIDFVQKPVEMEELGQRIRDFLAREEKPTLREKTISELMVPASRYHRVHVDRPLREIVKELHQAMLQPNACSNPDSGRRTLLVFDRKETFMGLIRAEDIVRVMIPKFMIDSPYSSYFTGMFLAQAKVVGSLTIDEIVFRHPGINVGAPLMEALHVIISDHLSHLPVFGEGRLLGLLRPEDLFKEITSPLPG